MSVLRELESLATSVQKFHVQTQPVYPCSLLAELVQSHGGGHIFIHYIVHGSLGTSTPTCHLTVRLYNGRRALESSIHICKVRNIRSQTIGAEESDQEFMT